MKKDKPFHAVEFMRKRRAELSEEFNRDPEAFLKNLRERLRKDAQSPEAANTASESNAFAVKEKRATYQARMKKPRAKK